MMAAACRGLLKPDYRYGIASRAREAMILTMINMEWIGEALYRKTLSNEIVSAPHYDPNKLPEIIKATNRLTDLTTSYVEYDKYNTVAPEEKILSETETLIKEYKKFIESGAGEEFLQRVNKINKSNGESK